MHKYHIYNTPVIEGIMHQGIEYEMEEKQKKLAVEIQKTGGDSWEGEFQEIVQATELSLYTQMAYILPVD